MKTICVILLFLLLGCDTTHKRPTRNREKATTEVQTQTPCPDCPKCPEAPPCPEETHSFECIILNEEDRGWAAAAMEQANKSNSKTDKDFLWENIYKKYPEVQNGGWTLYQEGDVLYMKKQK